MREKAKTKTFPHPLYSFLIFAQPGTHHVAKFLHQFQTFPVLIVHALLGPCDRTLARQRLLESVEISFQILLRFLYILRLLGGRLDLRLDLTFRLKLLKLLRIRVRENLKFKSLILCQNLPEAHQTKSRHVGTRKIKGQPL